MIIDCHVNIWENKDTTKEYKKQFTRIKPGKYLPPTPSIETTYKAMKQVDKAIVFPLSYGDSVGIESNDNLVAKAIKKHPEKFIGFTYLDPRKKDYMKILKHGIHVLNLKGIKYGPIYNRVPLDDSRLEKVYQYCIKNNLPITLHMGTTFASNTLLDLGRPLHVDAIAQKFPYLKIILAHMGHPWCDECIAVIRKNENVYGEISAIHYRKWQFFNTLISIQDYKVVDKIFFGTDFPFTTVEESIRDIKNINSISKNTGLPKILKSTINTIIHSNPLDSWWHK